MTERAGGKTVNGRAPTFRAPGRVNLIGEHTDYNEGFVMPAAIGFATYASVKPREDRLLKIFSENFSEEVEFNLYEPNPQARRHWSDYVIGVAVTLLRSGYDISGASLRVKGEVPIGSGLSSSAAIEVATAFALLSTSQRKPDLVTLAKLCQRAENEFVGMQCGIMDQFVSCMGEAGKALLLDCRTLDYKLLPVPPILRLVICNTMVKHELAAGEYNVRRAQCAEGVAGLANKLPKIRALRDASISDLEKHGADLPPVVFRRCRHVVSENARVLAAADALEQSDFQKFGQLMRESHASLRGDYEVSCYELDLMVELADTVPGVYGARMTGGGFGGCTVNLVRAEAVDQLKEVVSSGYFKATNIKPDIYVCEPSNGAGEVIEEPQK
jgi:galactokinase